MSSTWIYVISRIRLAGHPAVAHKPVLRVKNSNAGQYVQTFQSNSFIPALLIDNSDFNVGILADINEPIWFKLGMMILNLVCVTLTLNQPVSVSVSAQDGIVALGKAHTRSAPSLSSLPKVALETVPIFAWLNTDRSRPLRVECRPLLFSTPLSFRRSML